MNSRHRVGQNDMGNDSMQARTTIAAPAEAVFAVLAVLADPASHPAIDGTGWVSNSLDPTLLTGPGQTFRMAMYHANHPGRQLRDD